MIRWLRRFRFGMRTALVVALFWSIVLGLFFAKLRNDARRERSLKERIADAGGTTYAVAYRPAWLQALVADQDLSQVTVVHLDDADVQQHDLAALSALPRLGGLHLCKAKVSGDAMLHINRLGELRQLDLSRSTIRDVRLRGLRFLQDLNLTGLELDQLELRDLPALESLNLGFSTADDGDLASLTIASLTSLDLRGTHVTDRGLADLSRLSKLTTVYVYHTAVTRAGAAQLQRTLPNCRIVGAR